MSPDTHTLHVSTPVYHHLFNLHTFKIKTAAYLSMEISLRSDQLVGWLNSQWKENLVGLQTQGFVCNEEAVTPIKQFGFWPLLSLTPDRTVCLPLCRTFARGNKMAATSYFQPLLKLRQGVLNRL